MWALWHPTGLRPAREGGSWIAPLEYLRWARYGWIGCLMGWGLCVLVQRAYPVEPYRGIASVIGFALGLCSAIAITLDVLATPLARLTRRYTTEALEARIGEAVGASMAGLRLVGVTHDRRPEWPPGSFADYYAFLEFGADKLVLHRSSGELSIPRAAVVEIAPARYSGSRYHGLQLGDVRTPALTYRSDERAALKSIAIEALSGIRPADVARATERLYQDLSAWLVSAAPTGYAPGTAPTNAGP